jgi:hypothetical protein
MMMMMMMMMRRRRRRRRKKKKIKRVPNFSLLHLWYVSMYQMHHEN